MDFARDGRGRAPGCASDWQVHRPPPTAFHVFRREDRRYLLDVERTAVFSLGEGEYASLGAYEASPSACSWEKARPSIEQVQRLGFLAQHVPHKFEATRDAFIDACLGAWARKMWLLVAQACNFRCHYCYGVGNRYEDKGGLMSPKVARAAVDLMLRRSGPRRTLRITFFGGEPALNMTVVRETVRYSRERTRAGAKRVLFSMSTNGILLGHEDLDFCIENEFAMQYSLDGDRAGHDLHRRSADGQGTYDDSVMAVQRYMARTNGKTVPKIRATMTPGNHDPRRIANHFEKLGFRFYGIGSCQPCSEKQGVCDLDEPEMTALEATFEEHAKSILTAVRARSPTPKYNPFYRAFPGLRQAMRSIVGCGVGRNDTAVGWDGRLYPCHRYVGMIPYVIGDVWRGIDAARARAYYEDLFDALHTSCHRCWARNLCTGHCPWSRAGREGRHLPPSKLACEHVKRSIERVLDLYFEIRAANPDLLESIVQGAAG